MSKSKNTKKFKLNPLAVVALVLCALIAVYCGTTAWITSGVPLNPLRLTSLQDFAYTIYVKTTDSDWVPQSAPLEFKVNESGKLVTAAGKEISDYSFKAVQTGNGVAFARVRISQEWVAADGIRFQGEYNMPFIVADKDKLLDNRFNDGYVYYKGAFPVGGVGVEFFSGFDKANFDTSAIPENVTLRLDITVDAVQFNRYQQFWGMDKLPWR